MYAIFDSVKQVRVQHRLKAKRSLMAVEFTCFTTTTDEPNASSNESGENDIKIKKNVNHLKLQKMVVVVGSNHLS